MTLKIYPVVLELVPRLAPRLDALNAQLEAWRSVRARAHSVPLNVAEGAYSRGKNRQARYQTAPRRRARRSRAGRPRRRSDGRTVGPRDPRIVQSRHRDTRSGHPAET